MYTFLLGRFVALRIIVVVARVNTDHAGRSMFPLPSLTAAGMGLVYRRKLVLFAHYHTFKIILSFLLILSYTVFAVTGRF